MVVMSVVSDIYSILNQSPFFRKIIVSETVNNELSSKLFEPRNLSPSTNEDRNNDLPKRETREIHHIGV